MKMRKVLKYISVALLFAFGLGQIIIAALIIIYDYKVVFTGIRIIDFFAYSVLGWVFLAIGFWRWRS
jgi:hypothetical protein